MKAVKTVRAVGGMFIADEVQPGFARTGDQMWGFGRHGVLPDFVTLGEPMGNGYLMAGLAVRSKNCPRSSTISVISTHSGVIRW